MRITPKDHEKPDPDADKDDELGFIPTNLARHNLQIRFRHSDENADDERHENDQPHLPLLEKRPADNRADSGHRKVSAGGEKRKAKADNGGAH
jgi:hypothetical protein